MNGNALFKGIYSKSKGACGKNCLFFTQDNKKIQLDYATARLIQGRIMKILYDNGYRVKNGDKYWVLRDEINKYAHFACQPERLSEKDMFRYSQLCESECVCDSLNSNDKLERRSRRTLSA
jgi:hypothetical protein